MILGSCANQFSDSVCGYTGHLVSLSSRTKQGTSTRPLSPTRRRATSMWSTSIPNFRGGSTRITSGKQCKVDLAFYGRASILAWRSADGHGTRGMKHQRHKAASDGFHCHTGRHMIRIQRLRVIAIARSLDTVDASQPLRSGCHERSTGLRPQIGGKLSRQTALLDLART
jgi:hypothetical protein